MAAHRLFPALASALLSLAAVSIAVAAPHGKQAPGIAHFDVFADGDTLHLLVGERDHGGAIALLHRRSDDAGKSWSAAVRVNSKDDAVFAPHPGETPQIAARGKRVVAIWTDARGEEGHGGPIASALSNDGGATWAPGPNPTGDSSRAYHALVELGAGTSGFHAVWLRRGSGDGAALHYASSGDGARWEPQELVDEYTCQCCWNRVAETTRGFGVLYRGGEPRDMRYATRLDGQWRKTAAGVFDWSFKGCPHVGGALAVGKRDALHALVWTGVEQGEGLYYLASSDGGAHWSRPLALGPSGSAVSDLALAADGTLTALMLTQADGGSAIHRTESRDGGRTWTQAQTVSGKQAIASLPRAVASAGKVVTFWLERRGGEAASLRVDGRPLRDAHEGIAAAR